MENLTAAEAKSMYRSVYRQKEMHEKAIHILELVDKAEKAIKGRKWRLEQKDKGVIGLWSTPRWKIEEQIETAQKVYNRLLNFYFNHLDTIKKVIN